MTDFTPYELAVHNERQFELTRLLRAACDDYNNAEVLNALCNIAVNVFLSTNSNAAASLLCAAFCETVRETVNGELEAKQ